jgi:hypothetical protein
VNCELCASGLLPQHQHFGASTSGIIFLLILAPRAAYTGRLVRSPPARLTRSVGLINARDVFGSDR